MTGLLAPHYPRRTARANSYRLGRGTSNEDCSPENLDSADSHDSGLTLVEVLVAVIIVVIVALGGAGISINGIQTASAQQRQQVAVTIANAAMEKVSGWSVSDLYTGRFSTTVTRSVLEQLRPTRRRQTYPVSDSAATTSSTPSIPITIAPPDPAATQNGTAYTITTLIGNCYEAVTGGTCGLVTGYADGSDAPSLRGTRNSSAPSLIVKWTAGAKCAVERLLLPVDDTFRSERRPHLGGPLMFRFFREREARRSRGDRGFTVIELMIAVAIFGIFITVVTSSIVSIMKASTKVQVTAKSTSGELAVFERLRPPAPLCRLDQLAGSRLAERRHVHRVPHSRVQHDLAV